MKKSILFIFLLIASPAVFAGPKDMNLLNSMLLVGVSQIVVGNQSIARISNISCSGSAVASRCFLETEIEADMDESTTQTEKLRVVGSTAKGLLDSLIAIGSPSFESRNGIAVRLVEITCVQPFKGQYIPSDEETVCQIR